MKLVSLGNLQKGCPVFLNQEPYSMVGSIKVEKAGEGSVVTITLDDKMFKLGAKAPKAKRGRKPGKPKAKAAGEKAAAPKKRGRKPGRPKAKAAPRKKAAGRPKKEKVAKVEEAAV